MIGRVQVVQPGQPCHLYFDIEYKTQLNPACDGPGVMPVFRRLLEKHLEQHLSVAAAEVRGVLGE